MTPQLRQAILDAADGDTIRFDADITLAADLPAVQTDVTIDGDGHRLAGDGQFRGFFIGAWQPGTATPIAVDVTINDLSITDAVASGGVGGGGGGAGLGAALFVANLATSDRKQCLPARQRRRGRDRKQRQRLRRRRRHGW